MRQIEADVAKIMNRKRIVKTLKGIWNYCTRCGEKNDGKNFCTNCGTNLIYEVKK